MRRPIVVLSTGFLPLLLAAQAVNDEPCTALTLPVDQDCISLAVDNLGATLTTTVASPGCGSLVNADVWYLITVPPSGLLRIEATAGTMTDAAMALYSAPSCDGPFTLLECDDDDGPGQMPYFDFNDLEPGTIVYLRLWGYNGEVGSLGLCAYGILEFPEGDCIYQLELFDSFGDGWGTGARIGYSVNGGPVTLDSLEAGGYAVRLIGVDIGDVLTLSYTAGALNAENSVGLGLYGTAGAFYQGWNMSTSTDLYTGVVDCEAPPPLPGDCVGATRLCGDTVFPGAALTNGFAVDLNPTNQGCLISGERGGIWTRFTIATDGTLGFTLSPVWTSDFDFAIWGPLDSIVCPPVGNPTRCSYSALSGNTGLSTAALDNFEGPNGDGWLSALAVQAGEQYLLYIDNYSQESSPLGMTWQLSDGASLLCPPPPNAQFQVFNANLQPGGASTFIDQSTNDPTAWSWSFPGGTPANSTAQNPAGVTYALPGCYDVSLTAYNPGGGGSTTQLCAITVDGTTGIEPVTNAIQFTQQASGISLKDPNGVELHVLLFDATGRIVTTGHGAGRIELSTTGLATGHYLVVIPSDRGHWSRRIVVVP
ncbi:MAG: PKD domain-containing protein [Flavobacteriales bacterium]|nr:PKD domain-containing protein [Flavobacteriales bacterium]